MQMWSSVEEGDYFRATLLYIKAEQAHSRLINDETSTRLLVHFNTPHKLLAVDRFRNWREEK